MEEFKRQIYKKPEWQNKKEKDVDLENLEYSKKIANEKLEKILKPGFRDFGVRYMNIEEYRDLIENEKLSGEFTLFNNYRSFIFDQGNDFLEFLRRFKTGYEAGESISMTEWEEISGLSSVKTINILTGINAIRNEYKGREEEILNAIRQYLLNYINTGIDQPEKIYHHENDYFRFQMPNGRRNLNPDLKRLEKLDESNENLKIIKSF